MRPRLSKDFVLERKKIRTMEAAARLVSVKGIDGTKVSDLVSGGGIARLTFYEIFDGKDDCLEQTLAWIGASARRQVVEASVKGPAGALSALLDFVAERRDQAAFYLLYGPSISLASYEAEQEAFTRSLGSREMVVGGVAHTLRAHLIKRADRDPRFLLEALCAFVAAAPPAGPLDHLAVA
jgi:AcrR family transcriptional regulator